MIPPLAIPRCRPSPEIYLSAFRYSLKRTGVSCRHRLNRLSRSYSEDPVPGTGEYGKLGSPRHPSAENACADPSGFYRHLFKVMDVISSLSSAERWSCLRDKGRMRPFHVKSLPCTSQATARLHGNTTFIHQWLIQGDQPDNTESGM